MMKKFCLAGVASLSLLGIPAFSDQTDPLAAIYACTGIADDSARLACFDSAVGRTQAAQSSGEFTTITREDSERVQEDSFGLTIPSMSALNIFSPGSRPNALADVEPEPAPEPEAAAAAPAPEPTPEPAPPVQMAEAPEAPEVPETPAEPIAPPPQPEPVPTPAPAPPPAPVAEEADPARPIEVERNDDGEIQAVSLRIQRITQNANDQITIYFENGQIWRQVENERIRLNRRNPPTFATIRRTRLGAYVLRLDGQGRSLLVRRVE